METRLSPNLFNADDLFKLARSPCEQFYKLAEVLLWRNEAAAGLIEQIDKANSPIERLTNEQRVLETIAKIDLNVANGGVGQFFWNCPIWVEHVARSLRSIGMTSLADGFERTFGDILARIGDFVEFRKRNSYSEFAGEIEFDDFAFEYRARQQEVYSKSVAYVMDHLEGFIVPLAPTQPATSN